MLYTRIRFLLIILFIVLGLLLHIKMGIASAWYLYLASLLLLFTHFLFGTVGIAFAKLKAGKVKESEKIINQVSKPQWLNKRHRAYYHFTKGMIALQQENLPAGEHNLNLATQLGLRNDNDRALALLNLAHICYVQKRMDDSRNNLQKAKSFNADDLMIKQNIEELEKVLAFPYN